MAAKDSNRLVFPMGLSFDMKETEKLIKEQMKSVQGLIDKQKLTAKIKFDVDKVGLKETLNLLKQIQTLQNSTGAKVSTPAAMVKANAAANATALKAEAQAARINAITQEDLAKKKIQTEAASQRLTRATTAQTNAFRTQKGILNGMPQMLNSYLSVLGAVRLLDNIKNITGEFELQRVALGAIIQDSERAAILFDQIKTKAVESPFMVKDLVAYTKQLAAFRVETEDLFDTMNMLADISAGLGVEMNRLILAYGQVKAASVLRGQELRQFTEAGIPLVQLLADKFTKLNGEAVTTAQVFKLISERAVPFEMIKEIFQDMTKEAGTFFNMQEIQAKTLQGMYRNLGDAFQIMFDEIGRGNRGVLVWVAQTARELAQNWRLVLAIISPLVIAWGSYNIALALSNNHSMQATRNATLLARAKNLEAAGNLKAAAATTAAAMANNVFTKSFYLLRAAMLANPITFWITALTAVASAIYSIVSYRSQTKVMAEEIGDAMNRIKATADQSVVSLELLMDKLRKANQGSQEYADIINEINKRYGDFLPKQLSTAQSYDQIAESVKGVTDAIMEQAKAKSYNAAAEKIEGNLTKTLEDSYRKAEKALSKKVKFTNLALSTSSFGFTEVEASKLIGDMLSKIKNSPELYKQADDVGTFVRQTLFDAMKAKGADVGFSGAIYTPKGLVSSLVDVARAYSELGDQIESTNNRINATYQTTGNPYTKVVEDLKNKYANLAEIINKKSYADDKEGVSVQRTTALMNLQKMRLLELLGVYRKFGQFNLAEQTEKEWSMLAKQGTEWQGIVDKMIQDSKGKGIIGISTFKYEEGDDFFSYVEGIKKSYKELSEKRKLYSQEGSKVSAFEKKNVEQLISTTKDLATSLGFTLETEKEINSASKTRIQILSNEVQLIEEAYEKYLKLSKQIGKPAAQENIAKQYAGKIPEGFAFTPEAMDKVYSEAIAAFRTMGKDATDEAFKTGLKQIDTQFDNLSNNLKDRLERLGDEIQQTQRANEFFEKMLGLTKNEDLAAKMTAALGLKRGDVRKSLREAVSLSLGDYGKNIAMGDISGAQDAVNEMKKAGMEDSAKFAQQQLDALVTYEQKIMEEIYSGLEDFQTAEDKKKKIMDDTAAYIAKIQSSTVIPSAEKPKMVQAAKKRESTSISDIEWEAFKVSTMYQQMFGDLDKVSTESLEAIKAKLLELSKTIGSTLDPANMKELVSKIESVQEKITERNPFKVWAESAKEIQNIKTSITALEQTVEVGKSIGMSEQQLSRYIELLTTLKGELLAVETEEQKAFRGMAEDMSMLMDAASGVVSGVKAIFEEFGIGEDTIAGKALALIETIGTSVMNVINATAKVAAESISTVEKASVILTIISAVLAIATKIYSMFSTESNLTKTIEKLERTISHLQDMYDRLKLDTLSDPAQLKRLEQELDLRRQMLEVTTKQMRAQFPDLAKETRKAILSGINIIPTSTKDFANFITLGVSGWIKAFMNYSKIKKYNEYIAESNERLKYQTELYKIINSNTNNIAKTAQARIANLTEQNRLLQKQIDAEIKRGRKMDIDKVMKLQEQMAANEVDIIYAYVDTLKDAIGDLYANISESVTDALTSAFENGEDAAKAFEQTIDKVMRKVVIDLWKVNVLSKILQPLMSSIYKALGLDENGNAIAGQTPDFNITDEEARNIKKVEKDVGKMAITAYGQLEDILKNFSSDLGGSELTGIAKGISTASEETVLTLSGYANSLLYYSVGSYNIQAKMLEILEASTGKNNSGEDMGVMNNLYSVQSAALTELKAINLNTGRNAETADKMLDFMNKLYQGGKYINVKLQ